MPVFNDADVMYGILPYSYINRGDEAYLIAGNSRFKVRILGIFSISDVLVAPIRNSVKYDCYATGKYLVHGWTNEHMKVLMKECGVRHSYCSPTAKVLLVHPNSLKFIKFGYHSSYRNRSFSPPPVGTNSFELTEIQLKYIWDRAGPRARLNVTVCDNRLWYSPRGWIANYQMVMTPEGTIIRSRPEAIDPFPPPPLTGQSANENTQIVRDSSSAINQELLYRLMGDELMRPKKVKSKRTDYKRSYVFCG